MELADMRDLGSRAERRAGSTPVTRTKNREGHGPFRFLRVSPKWDNIVCFAFSCICI